MPDREKVIKGLECCRRRYFSCIGCPYKDESHRSVEECLWCRINDAIALLKEQEAVKPIYNEEKYGDHLPHCGNCEKVLPDNAVYGKVNFCHYCGKAVK